MTIYKSAEDYLERVLMLREEKGVVYSIDVARAMNVSKPSVSVAMKRLEENGYIKKEKDHAIVLLPPGEEVAQRVYSRHRLLKEFLMQLGVSEENATADACMMEHEISEESIECIYEAAQRGRAKKG